MSAAWTGTSRGRSRREPLPTRTTRFSPRRSKKWPVTLFRKILPRHVSHLRDQQAVPRSRSDARLPGDEERVRHLSIIDEPDDKYVRMAHLAVIEAMPSTASQISTRSS